MPFSPLLCSLQTDQTKQAAVAAAVAEVNHILKGGRPGQMPVQVQGPGPAPPPAGGPVQVRLSGLTLCVVVTLCTDVL